MGLYGNITNTNRTQFVFDKIFPNRATMDAGVASDGIFVGRFVLVDYDTAISEESENPLSPSGDYKKNYAVDEQNYPTEIGRGWDSTVWQKVSYNGKLKYTMVAELNSVVPSIDLKIDPPTINPVSPHFDGDMTNINYTVHVQPSWGFQVREAVDAKKSDTDITYLQTTYSVDEETGKYSNQAVKTSKTYAGDIYYNKAGFDSLSGYVVDGGKDIITVTADGRSGTKYNQYHNEGDSTELVTAPDIQQLSINLPSIGNAVATMWDIIYGENAEGEERNQIISWDNTSGPRMVEAVEDTDGFTCNTEKVATLAGCINSVHDLMGQIIINEVPENANEALKNRIYYKDNGYYIKDSYYNFIESTSGNSESFYLTDMPDNIYYRHNGNYYNESISNYDESNTYYAINDNYLQEQPLSEYKYSANTYFYYNDGFEIDTNSSPTDSREYFIIEPDEDTEIRTITNQWKEGEACFLPSNMSTEVFEALFPWKDCTRVVSGVPAVSKTGGAGLFRRDSTGKYYRYYQNDASKVTDNTLYYIENFSYGTVTTDDNTTEDGYLITDLSRYYYPALSITNITVYPFEAKSYYSKNEDGSYTVLSSESNITVTDINATTYQTYLYMPISDTENDWYIKVADSSKPFYVANNYYYKDGKNIILAFEKEAVSDKSYYIFATQPTLVSNVKYYMADTFYYYDDSSSDYVLDDSSTATSGRLYYREIPTQRYVVSDENGIYAVGALWNENIAIPSGVKVGYRQIAYRWKKLEGFARNLNTIHGLIIKINEVLKLDDKTTRDNTTVQGCINTINDIIAKFSELSPDRLLITNSYGQVTSAKIGLTNLVQTTTEFSYNNQKMTIQGLFEYIKTLEDRIAALESVE